MKQTVVGFALGAVIASGIALLMNRGPESSPTPEPVAATQPLAVVQAPTPEPVVAPPEPPKPASVAPVAVKRRKRVVESVQPRVEPDPRPTPVARTPEPSPAPVPTPAPEPPRTVAVVNPPTDTQPEKPSPPEPVAKTATIPAGTLINARMLERVSSADQGAGDTFAATLSEPLVVDGFVIAERNARLEGSVVESSKGGRVKGVAHISIVLTRLTTADGQKVAIETESFVKKGPDTTKQDAVQVGVGAAIGAAIGAIAGGGKGAGIGAAAGGGAGAGKVIVERGKPAELPVETRVSFRLNSPVTVTEKLKR